MRNALRRAMLAPIILVLLYLGISLCVAARLTAPDRRPAERTPATVGLTFREVRLSSTDGLPLTAWWVPGDSSRAAVLVHGWGGGRSERHVLNTARVYARAGYGVLMLDLRGHGGSAAARRTLGLREGRDVRGALAWLTGRGIGPERVVLHGWSMGGAAVIRAAPGLPGTAVAAVVEEAAYADLPLLLRARFRESSGLPDFFRPGAFLVAQLFLNLDARDVRPKREAAELYSRGVPLFVIHSADDGIVPLEHARLFAEAHPDADLWRLEGYRHVEAYAHPEYEERLLRFLRKATAEAA